MNCTGFSKAQQDFFLPLLESGELTLLATTTENPSFSVTRQLLSRLHVLRLKALAQKDLCKLGHEGAKRLNLELVPEALDTLAPGQPWGRPRNAQSCGIRGGIARRSARARKAQKGSARDSCPP